MMKVAFCFRSSSCLGFFGLHSLDRTLFGKNLLIPRSLFFFCLLDVFLCVWLKTFGKSLMAGFCPVKVYFYEKRQPRFNNCRAPRSLEQTVSLTARASDRGARQYNYRRRPHYLEKCQIGIFKVRALLCLAVTTVTHFLTKFFCSSLSFFLSHTIRAKHYSQGFIVLVVRR